MPRDSMIFKRARSRHAAHPDKDVGTSRREAHAVAGRGLGVPPRAWSTHRAARSFLCTQERTPAQGWELPGFGRGPWYRYYGVQHHR